MKKSFQEQLLQLGLVDKKKAGQAKKEQHHNKKQKAKAGKNVVVVDENALLAQQIDEKKKARARQLNLQREAKLQKRAEAAQVKQLVEQNRLDKDDRGIAYRFTVSGKIQRIFVATAIADQLSDGRLGIVGIDGRYEVVPRATIGKIQSINDGVFVNIVAPSSSAEKDPDDPYAGYEVPDDLMW